MTIFLPDWRRANPSPGPIRLSDPPPLFRPTTIGPPGARRHTLWQPRGPIGE